MKFQQKEAVNFTSNKGENDLVFQPNMLFFYRDSVTWETMAAPISPEVYTRNTHTTDGRLNDMQ